MPAPTLDAYRDGVHLKTYCTHCLRWHSHGVCGGTPGCPTPASYGRKSCTCPPGSGDGHRVAHCGDPSSPYRDTGYVLKERDDFTGHPELFDAKEALLAGVDRRSAS